MLFDVWFINTNYKVNRSDDNYNSEFELLPFSN